MTDRQTDRQTRNITIDITKGLAVIFVLWGHYIQCSSVGYNFYEDAVFKTIYSFHMPLFAILSGYLFYGTCQRHNLCEVIRTRVTNFLVPIFTWSTINWIIICILQKNIQLLRLLQCWTDRTFWFLWAVFAGQIVLIAVEKLFSDKYKIVGVSLGFFA